MCLCVLPAFPSNQGAILVARTQFGAFGCARLELLRRWLPIVFLPVVCDLLSKHSGCILAPYRARRHGNRCSDSRTKSRLFEALRRRRCVRRTFILAALEKFTKLRVVHVGSLKGLSPLNLNCTVKPKVFRGEH